MIAAVLPTLQREDASVDREPGRDSKPPRINGARASLDDVAAVAAELNDPER